MAIEQMIGSYPESVQTLAGDARRMLREWLPEAKEAEDVSARMIVYTYGPGYKGMICTLILSKSGIKLGIAGGASFPDPHNLLRGSGKVHRHVQLYASQDLKQPGLKRLVLAAGSACNARLGRR